MRKAELAKRQGRRMGRSAAEAVSSAVSKGRSLSRDVAPWRSRARGRTCTQGPTAPPRQEGLTFRPTGGALSRPLDGRRRTAMHKDPNLRKRNALVIPGGLLALYGFLGVAYVAALRGDDGSCGDATLIVFLGECRSALL